MVGSSNSEDLVVGSSNSEDKGKDSLETDIEAEQLHLMVSKVHLIPYAYTYGCQGSSYAISYFFLFLQYCVYIRTFHNNILV